MNLDKKWLWSIFLCVTLASIMCGCAVAPKKLAIEDLSKSFDEGTIISAKTGTPVSFEDLMADLATVQVVYIGENHADPAHHEIQLRIIRELFKKHPDMSVGMEMFDRTYQQVLNLWSAGKLCQETFLKRVHWYTNWRFNFELYSDILDFIKEKKIRLVGLNIPFHIPPKIAIGGIESLSYEEKRHLPKKIDTSNTAHRAFVKEVFEHHRHIKGRGDFENFHMAQCVWEDIMAESIALNLDGGIMAVLVGNGHIKYGFGVPDRAFSRTQAPFRTVFLASAARSNVSLSVADYIWVTPSRQRHLH